MSANWRRFVMAHYKRRRLKNRRAGCLLCRPWKINGALPADKDRVGELRRLGGRFHRFTERVVLDE
jgi:hypothetical protein